MAEFKVGDRVRVHRNVSNDSKLLDGQICTIGSVESGGRHYLTVERPRGVGGGIYGNELELVADEPPKVGDQVEILAHKRFDTSGTSQWKKDNSVGQIGYVDSIVTGASWGATHIVWQNHPDADTRGEYYGHYGPDELKLVAPKNYINDKQAIKVSKEKKTMDKFYRVKKDTIQLTAGAVVANYGNDVYSPISPLWNVVDDVTPTIGKEFVTAKQNSSYFERVYPVHVSGKTIYLPKKEAQAEFEEQITTKPKSK